jgi:hypothetical protein
MTEVRRLQVRSDHEQHRLLSMIERMHREGRSEHEIVAALGEAGARGASRPRRSRITRPARGRLARWASARLRA